jgi:hypothetical protein
MFWAGPTGSGLKRGHCHLLKIAGGFRGSDQVGLFRQAGRKISRAAKGSRNRSLDMNKFAIAAVVTLLGATSALAGGYAAPVIEAEPIVVEAAAAPSGSMLIPALLAVVVVAAVASNDSSNNTPDEPK